MTSNARRRRPGGMTHCTAFPAPAVGEPLLLSSRGQESRRILNNHVAVSVRDTRCRQETDPGTRPAASPDPDSYGDTESAPACPPPPGVMAMPGYPPDETWQQTQDSAAHLTALPGTDGRPAS